jgi:hypothetical protein
MLNDLESGEEKQGRSEDSTIGMEDKLRLFTKEYNKNMNESITGLQENISINLDRTQSFVSETLSENKEKIVSEATKRGEQVIEKVKEVEEKIKEREE